MLYSMRRPKDRNHQDMEAHMTLSLVWWETPVRDEAGSWWGQMAGATHRVRVLADYFEQLARRRDAVRAVRELTFNLENFFVRVYELRERAIAVVESIANVSLGSAKDPEKRIRALLKVAEKYFDLRETLFTLLELLDHDISTRNVHTHSQFLSLQLVIPPAHFYDPEDVLQETAGTTEDRLIRRALLREVKSCAREHAEKARLIAGISWTLLERAQEHIRATA
jgi:hypothetical protein